MNYIKRLAITLAILLPVSAYVAAKTPSTHKGVAQEGAIISECMSTIEDRAAGDVEPDYTNYRIEQEGTSDWSAVVHVVGTNAFNAKVHAYFVCKVHEDEDGQLRTTNLYKPSLRSLDGNGYIDLS